MNRNNGNNGNNGNNFRYLISGLKTDSGLISA